MFKSIFGRVLAVMARTSGLLVSVFLVAMPGVPRAQLKMDSYDRDRAETFLRDAYDAVKKHYYDPKFHGVDLDARYQEYQGKIASAPSSNQVTVLVAEFLDGLKDPQTYFIPPFHPYRIDPGFRMVVIGNDCFITQVRPGTDAATKVHPGDQVIAFDNYALNRDDFPRMNYFFGFLSPKSASILDIRDSRGEKRQITVDAKIHELKRGLDFGGNPGGVDVSNVIRYQQDSEHVMRQRTAEVNGVMIWKMPVFFLNEDEVDRLFGRARKHKALILDLRGNSSGSLDTLKHMIGDSIDHRVKIADRVARNESKPEIPKIRYSNGFVGKLIVLLDSGSATCSEIFARVVQLENRGTVLGDRSAGIAMESRWFPYSQGMGEAFTFYSFSVTEADLLMRDGKNLEHVGVTPDEIILPTASDLAGDRDPVLARAAELAGVSLDSTAAGKLFPFEWRPE